MFGYYISDAQHRPTTYYYSPIQTCPTNKKLLSSMSIFTNFTQIIYVTCYISSMTFCLFSDCKKMFCYYSSDAQYRPAPQGNIIYIYIYHHYSSMTFRLFPDCKKMFCYYSSDARYRPAPQGKFCQKMSFISNNSVLSLSFIYDISSIFRLQKDVLLLQ